MAPLGSGVGAGFGAVIAFRVHVVGQKLKATVDSQPRSILFGDRLQPPLGDRVAATQAVAVGAFVDALQSEGDLGIVDLEAVL